MSLMTTTATNQPYAVPPMVIPEGVREGNEKLVRLTPESGVKVRSLIAREQKGEFLRIAITGGGCNGLSYKLRFTPEPKRGDILVRSAGVLALVVGKTALYLKGTVLDYSNELIAGGFKYSNPTLKPVVHAEKASVSRGNSR